MKKLVIEITSNNGDFREPLNIIVDKIKEWSTNWFEERDGERYSFEIKDE